MEKLKEIEEIILSVLNAHSLQVSSLYATMENPYYTESFIRDNDGKFKTIANEIAKKLLNKKNMVCICGKLSKVPLCYECFKEGLNRVS